MPPWAASLSLCCQGSQGIHASGRDQSPSFSPGTGQVGRPKQGTKEGPVFFRRVRVAGPGAWCVGEAAPLVSPGLCRAYFGVNGVSLWLEVTFPRCGQR